MRKVITLFLLMIHFETFADIAKIKECAGGNPSDSAEECRFSTNDQNIKLCCDSKGAAFCGPSQCVCAKGENKIDRLQKNPELDMCYSGMAQEHYFRTKDVKAAKDAKAKSK